MSIVPGAIVSFVGHIDDVPSHFENGDQLEVIYIYGPDEDWHGGIKARRIDDGQEDFAWLEEVEG